MSSHRFENRIDRILYPVITALQVSGYKITKRVPIEAKDRVIYYVGVTGYNGWFITIQKLKKRELAIVNIPKDTYHIHEKELPEHFMDSILELIDLEVID